MDEVVYLPHPPPQGRIEVVFDAVVSPTLEKSCYFRPFVSEFCMLFEKFFVLLFGPFATVIELGSEVIMPPTSYKSVTFRGIAYPFSGNFPISRASKGQLPPILVYAIRYSIA